VHWLIILKADESSCTFFFFASFGNGLYTLPLLVLDVMPRVDFVRLRHRGIGMVLRCRKLPLLGVARGRFTFIVAAELCAIAVSK
jgi:hypothetical protein